MHLCQSAQGKGQPTMRQALRARAFDRDPICGEHYGQRPCSAPHSKAGHMAAPTSSVQKVKNLLPTRSRPHMAHPRPTGITHLVLAGKRLSPHGGRAIYAGQQVAPSIRDRQIAARRR